MTYGQIQDVVREHFGRIGWPTTMLKTALDSARRDIEKNSNGGYYWMRTTDTGSLVAAQQSYSITTSTSNGFNLPDFKDARALSVKESTSTVWSDVALGTVTLEEAERMFATDEDDLPTLAIIDNTTMTFFPIPDDTYDYKLWFWQWTDNPSANTGTDELTDRFPEALIYGALVWGCEQYEKAYQDADRWHSKFVAEQQKIHRHNIERERQDRGSWVPMTGAYALRRQTDLGRQIWV